MYNLQIGFVKRGAFHLKAWFLRKSRAKPLERSPDKDPFDTKLKKYKPYTAKNGLLDQL